MAAILVHEVRSATTLQMPESTLSAQSETMNLATREAPLIYYFLAIFANSLLNFFGSIEGSVTDVRVYICCGQSQFIQQLNIESVQISCHRFSHEFSRLSLRRKTIFHQDDWVSWVNSVSNGELTVAPYNSAGIFEQSMGPGTKYRKRVLVPARQATQTGGINSLESISGHHRSLKIPPLDCPMLISISLFSDVSYKAPYQRCLWGRRRSIGNPYKPSLIAAGVQQYSHHYLLSSSPLDTQLESIQKALCLCCRWNRSIFHFHGQQYRHAHTANEGP